MLGSGEPGDPIMITCNRRSEKKKKPKKAAKKSGRPRKGNHKFNLLQTRLSTKKTLTKNKIKAFAKYIM